MLYYYRDLGVSEIVDLLIVSTKMVRRIIKLFKDTGDVEPTKQCHEPERRLDALEEMTLIQYLMVNPSAYLDELQMELQDRTGVAVSVATVCRTLHRLGLTRKKLRHVVMCRSEDSCAEFKEEMANVDADMIVWIDEIGSDRRDASCRYGYHLRGMTLVSYTLSIRGKRLSVITALSTRGIEDIEITEGTVDGDFFVHFVEHTLLPILQPFNGSNARSIVVLDSASVHHVSRVAELIHGVGALLRFLPAYSLDFQPLEEAFSKVKYFLKENEVIYDSNCTPSLLISLAFTTVSPTDCVGYIQHAGYCI